MRLLQLSLNHPGKRVFSPVFIMMETKLDKADKLLPAVNYSETKLLLNVDIERYFEHIEIESDYLKILFFKTILRIVHSGFRQDLSFGSIIEGQTIAGGVAEVTRDHCIRIDSRQLNQFDEDIAMAMIAHELAHDHLRHFKHWTHNLENEHIADNLARQWGFNVDRFRDFCGAPRMNNRLLQIHS